MVLMRLRMLELRKLRNNYVNIAEIRFTHFPLSVSNNKHTQKREGIPYLACTSCIIEQVIDTTLKQKPPYTPRMGTENNFYFNSSV